MNMLRSLVLIAVIIKGIFPSLAVAKSPNPTQDTLELAANYWEPFTGDELEGNGIASQIVISTLEKLGYKVNVRFYPWARAYKMVSEGSADGIVAIWHTRDRAQKILFSEPYLTNRIVFIKQRRFNFDYSGLSSLDDLIIGVGREYDYNDAFSTANNFKRVEVTRFSQSLEMLYRGRIDLAVTDERIALFHIARSPKSEAIKRDIDFVSTALDELPLYFGMSKHNANASKIIEQFNAAITHNKTLL